MTSEPQTAAPLVRRSTADRLRYLIENGNGIWMERQGQLAALDDLLAEREAATRARSGLDAAIADAYSRGLNDALGQMPVASSGEAAPYRALARRAIEALSAERGGPDSSGAEDYDIEEMRAALASSGEAAPVDGLRDTALALLGAIDNAGYAALADAEDGAEEPEWQTRLWDAADAARAALAREEANDGRS